MPLQATETAQERTERKGRTRLKANAQLIRRKRLQHLSRCYKRRAMFAPHVCTYCGVPADTFDHVPPVTVAYELTREWLDKNGYGLWLVPACRQCNTRLGAKRVLTVEHRAKAIWNRLHRDLEKVRSAEWTMEELMELGPRLGAYVRAGADQVLLLKHRIAWAEGVAKMSQSDDDK